MIYRSTPTLHPGQVTKHLSPHFAAMVAALDTEDLARFQELTAALEIDQQLDGCHAEHFAFEAIFGFPSTEHVMARGVG